jgi:ribosomal subunit interface protein
MKTNVRGVHVHLGERFKDHVQSHLIDPILAFYDDEAAELDIHLRDATGKGGVDKECSVTLHIPGSSAIHVQEVTDDFFKSVDLCRDRLENSLKRELEKRRKPSGHSGPKAARA